MHFTLANHWARVIEMLYAAERMRELAGDPEIISSNVRTLPTETPAEGVGIVEAPRGTLIHHYRTDERGIVTKANLIAVALLPVFIAVTLLPFGAIWGWEALRSGFHDILRWSVFIPAFIVLVVLHEALHGAGYMRFGRVARSDIRFGVNWRAGAGPSQRSQSRPAGGWLSGGLPMPAGYMLPI